MAGVELSDVPGAGDDLEDYVASLFQAAGYFVEKNLTERDPGDILELDLIATEYSTPEPRSILCEAKGGKWGYPDLFKLVGWLRYLNMDRGGFFVKDPAGKDIDSVAKRVALLDVSLVHFGDFTDAVERFSQAGLGSIVGDEVLHVWRHSYAIERKLTAHVQNLAKTQSGLRGPAEVLAYHRLVNDGVFLAANTVSRLHQLYDAYKAHPKVTLACALEISGQEYDPQSPPTDSPLLTETMREGKHPLLQASMYVEHRARLAILKAAVDFICETPDGTPAFAVDGELNWANLLYYSLP